MTEHPSLPIADLLLLAADDERAGEAFYARAAERSSGDAATLFAFLATQERGHLREIQHLLAEWAPDAQTAPPDGHALGWGSCDDARAAADACADERAILHLAGRFERDMLMCLNELRARIGDDARPVMDRLAQEEQSHLVVLSRKLAGKTPYGAADAS